MAINRVLDRFGLLAIVAGLACLLVSSGLAEVAPLGLGFIVLGLILINMEFDMELDTERRR